MNHHLHVFEDFHIRGASAPEWKQQYLQMSPGAMRSALFEWSTDQVHVYRKWMSERVVQKGELPRGKICFAMLGKEGAGHVRFQGMEFGVGDLLVLHGGEEFEFQRPAGVEMLAVTFETESLLEFLDASGSKPSALRARTGVSVRPSAAALDELRQRIRRQLSTSRIGPAAELMDAVRLLLVDAPVGPRQRASSYAAAQVVRNCQRIATNEYREQPVAMDELCSRLRTSRRTLQNSFNQVAGTSPQQYLRNLRLNEVRRRLMATPREGLSVSAAAMEAGFDHLGHFTGNYKRLFGESPSLTPRPATRRS